MTDLLPDDYPDLLAGLKTRIREAQLRAHLAVNRELVQLYWSLGREIALREDAAGWGAQVIRRLSDDLRAAFPDARGYSPRNLLYMRQFAEAWPASDFAQQPVARIPWGHNCLLLDKVEGPHLRRWYAARVIERIGSPNHLIGSASK